VSEFDRRVTVMKLKAARERKRSRGERCEGRKPFGSFPGEIDRLTSFTAVTYSPPSRLNPFLRFHIWTITPSGFSLANAVLLWVITLACPNIL
jgi:hypothetical protein